MNFRARLRYGKNLRELIHHSGALIAGNLFAGIWGLAYLGILTRSVDLSTVGLFATVIGFVGIVERLVGFPSWQTVIHFGTEELGGSTPHKLGTVIRIAGIIDSLTSVAGVAVAMSLAFFLQDSLFQSSVGTMTMLIAATPLLLGVSSTATGVLRVFGRFRLIAIAGAFGPMVTTGIFLGLLLAGVNDLPLFVFGWAVGNLLSKLIIVVGASKLSKSHTDKSGSLTSMKAYLSEKDQFSRFVLLSKANGMVRALRDIDILLVSFFLGANMAGLYKIGRSIAAVFGRLTGPFHQAIFPLLSRLLVTGERKQMVVVMRQASVILGSTVLLGWVGFLFFGEGIIAFIFGAVYKEAFLPTSIMLIAMVIWSFAQSLSPGLLADGKVGTLSGIDATTTLIYIGSLISLSNLFGILGASAALVLFYLMWSSAALFFTLKQYNTLES